MDLTRRQIIKTVTAAALLAGAPAVARAALKLPEARSLKFENLHTGETLAVTYWEKGAYVKGALAEINHVLRDHRTGDIAPMDAQLMDLLNALQKRLQTTSGFQVISGYRSPASNSMLHARSDGVAKHSLHMEGKAVDIRVPGRELPQVRTAALELQRGGVGYYPGSDFVHIDTGRLRQW